MSKKPLPGLSGLVVVDEQSAEPVDPSHTLAPRPGNSPERDTNVAKARRASKPKPQLRKEGFLVHPQAKMQFEMLKAELKAKHRGPVGPGPWLLHEALNLLFKKYGKPTVVLEKSEKSA
jgi:hypothetical protein